MNADDREPPEESPAQDAPRRPREPLRELSEQERGLIDQLYEELARYARFRRRAGGHSITTHDALHEGLMRLLRSSDGSWRGSEHFQAYAARCVRTFLIDRARGKATRRETPSDDEDLATVAFEFSREGGSTFAPSTESVRRSLDRLRIQRRQLVEHRLFIGASHMDTARACASTPKKVRIAWAEFIECVRRDAADEMR